MAQAVSKPAGTPLWHFFALALGISWACWLVVALTGQDIFGDLEVGLTAVLGGFGPTIAAVVMLYRGGDAAAIRDYWWRVFDWRRIDAPWWLVALLLYPAVTLLAFAVSGSPLDASPLLALTRNPATLLAALMFVFVFGPLSEELGWRGYALDRLQAHYSALRASVILGVIWWAWHLPLLAVPGAFLADVGASPLFLAGYLYTVVLYAVLFTWLYNNTERSILAAVAFHFAINLTSRLVAVPAEVFVANSLLLTLVVAAVVWRYGGRYLKRGSAYEPGARP